MSPPPQLRIGELVIDLERWRVTLGGRPVGLSATEFRLLAHLARRAGQVVTYDELLEGVWGCPAEEGNYDMVRSCVRRVRRKLREDATTPRYVMTVRGVGYRLRDPAQPE